MRESDFGVFTEVEFSSEIFYNFFRLLSLVNFDVLNICSIIKFNFENEKGFRILFGNNRSLVLVLRFVSSFLVRSQWRSWQILLCSLVLTEWNLIFLSLFIVLFTLRYGSFDWRNWSSLKQWLLRSWRKWLIVLLLIISIGWFHILGVLGSLNWLIWLLIFLLIEKVLLLVRGRLLDVSWLILLITLWLIILLNW